jgi:hypothetical protein
MESKIRQPIHVLNLARIAHVASVRALRKLMAQVRHCDVWAAAFKQWANPILAAPAALGAFHPDHVELGRSLSERVGTVRHRHNQLSVADTRSIRSAPHLDIGFLYLWSQSAFTAGDHSVHDQRNRQQERCQNLKQGCSFVKKSPPPFVIR